MQTTVSHAGLLARPRRLRATSAIRSLAAETRVTRDMLVAPLFLDANLTSLNPRVAIASMPGIDRLTIDEAVREATELRALGIRAVLLFGIPDAKDAVGSSNSSPSGVVQRGIRAIKAAVPDLAVIADLCFCEYTSHGHCGVLDGRGNVDNDQTLALLAETARSYAECGVDIIAPSDMMDGRIQYLRRALDDDGYSDIALMSYAVKYASAFYGPFREAADSTPTFGDRAAYQMNPGNIREALREAQLDIDEGADFLIVKPAMTYLDVVYRVREISQVPIAVYNVSGEYAMVKAAAQAGWMDEARTVDEMMTSFVRAGASIIISYFARSFAARQLARGDI